MRKIGITKAKAELYKAMTSGNNVSIDWALKNVLGLGKNEFRRYKIKRIFGEE